ncbi:MAG: hypothetical protein ACUVQK_13790, partial [Thermogutta sp.]
MDQLKQILAVVYKHLFWIVCGLSVVIGLSVWFVAQASVSKSIEARKTELEGLRSQLSQIKVGSPNPQVVDATRSKIEELRSDVYQAWVAMYAAQKEKNKWPAALGQEFLAWVEAPNRKPGDPIPDRFREIYLNFIEQHFPTLFEIVDLRRPKDADLRQLGNLRSGTQGMMGYPGMGGGSEYEGEGYGTYAGAAAMGTGIGGTYGGAGQAARQVEMVGTVDWNPQSIAQLKSRFNWIRVPTSDEIWNAQEDLWVYEALLRVIRKSNEGASGQHNAVVKRIDALDIGPDAARGFGGARRGFAAGAMGSGSAMG